MRRYHLPAAAVTVLLSASHYVATAATVREALTGTIAGKNTVDRRGYFGPKGASLSGKQFMLEFSYVSEDFNANGTCRNKSCIYYTSSGNAPVGKSLHVKITVGGISRTYSPQSIGALFLSINGAPYFALDSDAYSGFGGYGSGVQVYLLTMSNPAFGKALSPENPPVLHKKQVDYIGFFDKQSETPLENARPKRPEHVALTSARPGPAIMVVAPAL